MRRLPTTLGKLSALEKKLQEEAEALAKKRAALVRQRDRMERQAQQERYIAVGKLVEKLGFSLGNLGELETTLNTLAAGTQSLPQNSAMFNTPSVPLEGEKTAP